MFKFIPLIFFVIFVMIVTIKGVPLIEGYDEEDGYNLNNIEGYLEEKRNIMEKHYDRLRRLHERSTSSTTTPSTTTVYNEAEENMQPKNNRTVIGKCEPDIVPLFKYTNIVNSISSGNSFSYTSNNVCIVCIITNSLGGVQTSLKLGGPGMDNVNLEISSISKETSRLEISVMGYKRKCET